MKFLTLEGIKKHLRIDDDYEDELLTLYAESAAQEALNFMERTLESIYEEYGDIPADIKLACYCRVGTAYKYREDITDRNLYRLPYLWEAKLMKYKPANKI